MASRNTLPWCDNRGISGIERFTQLVSRHPALSILGAVLAIGGAGALVDTLTGPSGEGASLCGEAPDPLQGRQQKGAARDYLALWTRAAPFLGSAGEPPPRLRFIGQAAPRPGRNEPMWVGPDEGNCRTIFIAPGARDLLANPGGSRRARRLHRVAERWTIHETAHYFQSDEVLRNPTLREYGATQWEKAHTRKLLGTRKKKVNATFNQWRDRDQFGSNFGGDPLTFTWPEAPVTPD